jgi:hypothetical protein
MKYLIVLLMLASSASAADFSANILDLNGQPFADDFKCPADATGKRPCQDYATLGVIATRALLATLPDEQNLSGEEKFKRFALAMKIKDGGNVALNAEDIALLKKLVGKVYSPLIVGRAFPLLDPAEKVTVK